MRFKELDTVVLTHDVPEYGLKEGSIGAIVHLHADGETVEVEFVTAAGRTVGVLTRKPENIRSIADREILHVREYSSSLGQANPEAIALSDLLLRGSPWGAFQICLRPTTRT